MDLLRAILQKHVRRLYQRTGRVADVVHDQADLVLHVADDRHFGDLARLFAALVDDGERRADPLGKLPRPSHPAHVG
jgi:hypothetical protein